MNLYLITQDTNNDFNVYDSAVVVAQSKEEAQKIHPDINLETQFEFFEIVEEVWMSSWTLPENVTVQLIGMASSRYEKPEVICASFNAA